MSLAAPEHHRVDSVRNVVLDFAYVKREFVKAIDKKRPMPDPAIANSASGWHEDRKSDWTGCSLKEMRDWLANGYTSKDFAQAGSYIPKRKKRSLRFGEEGELQVDLALSGHDFPFLDWEQRERKPGMRIVVDLCFSCGTTSKAITKYAAWVAGLLGSFEAQGYDLEVDVAFPVYGLFSGESGYTDSGNRTNTLVRVKRANEASDFTEWSAMFSPGGFRMLGFFAMGLVAQKTKKKLSYCIGYPADNGWSCDFREQERTLYLWTPNSGNSPPIDRLNEELVAHGLISTADNIGMES